MAGTNVERTSYGAFERFLYIFFIPVLFTVILTVVLLSLFGYNVSRSILDVANRIPVINKVIPDPDSNVSEPGLVMDSQPLPKAEDIQILKDQIAKLENEKRQGEAALSTSQAKLDDLQKEFDALK